MARTAIGEARGEGNAGMQAVMWTGMNRFTAKRWFSGRTIAGTFLKHAQYSCWLHSDVNYPLICEVTPEIGLFADALEWAARIMKGEIADPTQGATHYHAGDAPGWTKGATFTVQIGRHKFYKNVA